MKTRLFVVAALLLAFAAVALAQDTAKNDSTEKPDPRLDQKVTYQADGEFLYKVLGELSEKTGVTMNCGSNDKDWYVRETKVCIFIKDMPLKDLQQNLAKTLHYTWASSVKDNVISYRLYQDRRAKKEEESLRAEAKEAAIKKRLEQRKKALDELDRAVALSPDEIEKLKDESPICYFLAKEPVGKALSNLLKAVPEARSALLDGRDLSLSVSELSPEERDAVAEFKRTARDFYNRVIPAEADNSDIPEDEYAEDMTLEVFGWESTGSAEDIFFDAMLGEISVDGTSIPLFDVDNPVAKVMGKTFLRMSEGDEPWDEMNTEAEEREVEQMISKASDLPDTLEYAPDDLDLAKVVKLELPDSYEYPVVLDEIAKKAELQVISDYFENTSKKDFLCKTSGSLESILKGLAMAYDKRAKKAGNLVTYEDRNWFERRAWAVPEAWMERWRQAAEENNIQLEDLADMACFSDEQIEHTIREDSILKLCSWSYEITSNKEILRLYAVLSKSQRKALLTEEGLDTTTLTRKQWPFYEQLVSESKFNIYDADGQIIPTHLALVVDESTKEYIFGLTSRSKYLDGDEVYSAPIIWSIRLTEPVWEDELPSGVAPVDREGNPVDRPSDVADPSALPPAPGTPAAPGAGEQTH